MRKRIARTVGAVGLAVAMLVTPVAAADASAAIWYRCKDRLGFVIWTTNPLTVKYYNSTFGPFSCICVPGPGW